MCACAKRKIVRKKFVDSQSFQDDIDHVKALLPQCIFYERPVAAMNRSPLCYQFFYATELGKVLTLVVKCCYLNLFILIEQLLH